MSDTSREDRAIIRELRQIRLQISNEFRWIKSHLDSSTLRDLNRNLKKIMATQAEIVADLDLVLEQQLKTTDEIAVVQAGVADLQAQIVALQAIIDAGGGAGGEVSQALVDAVAAVKAQAQIIDDLIPDIPST